MERLAVHLGLRRERPGVAALLALRVIGHAGAVDAVERIGLLGRVVRDDAERRHRSHRSCARAVAHELIAAGKPLAVVAARHLAARPERSGLDFACARPLAGEVAERLLLRSRLRCVLRQRSAECQQCAAGDYDDLRSHKPSSSPLGLGAGRKPWGNYLFFSPGTIWKRIAWPPPGASF